MSLQIERFSRGKAGERRRVFSLRTLLLVTPLLGAGIGMAARWGLGFEPRPTAEEVLESLYQQLAAVNPESLEGWQTTPAGTNQKRASWSKDGLVYSDRNGDGRPDLKSRNDSDCTTNFFWEDNDYDGEFETAASHGCFHRDTWPLTPRVAVPTVSAEPS